MKFSRKKEDVEAMRWSGTRVGASALMNFCKLVRFSTHKQSALMMSSNRGPISIMTGDCVVLDCTGYSVYPDEDFKDLFEPITKQKVSTESKSPKTSHKKVYSKKSASK